MMKFEPNGNRLAVIFEGSEFVSLYSVKYEPLVEFKYIGKIFGPSNQKPEFIEWGRSSVDFGSSNSVEENYLLLVFWSGGKVQFFPKYS